MEIRKSSFRNKRFLKFVDVDVVLEIYYGFQTVAATTDFERGTS